MPCSGVLGCLSAAAVELSPVAPPVAVAVAVVVIDEAVVVSTARAQTRRTCMGSSFRIDTTSAWYRPSSFLPFTYKQIKIFESGFFSRQTDNQLLLILIKNVLIYLVRVFFQRNVGKAFLRRVYHFFLINPNNNLDYTYIILTIGFHEKNYFQPFQR